MSEGRLDWLRERGEGEAEVRPVELFFDLVYVLAVTQITHHLLEHRTRRGAGETLPLLLGVWLGWIHTTWITSYSDLGTRPVRLMLIGVMFVSLTCPPRCPRRSRIEAWPSRRPLSPSRFGTCVKRVRLRSR